MKVILVLLGLLALAAAQCSFEDQMFTSEDGTWSLTFGAAVGSWTPALLYYNDQPENETQTFLVSVTEANPSRYEVQDWFSTFAEQCDNDIVGHYNFQFDSDCESFTIVSLYDECENRSAAWDGATLELEDTPECYPLSEGSFAESEESPYLSGQEVSIMKAPGDYYLVSAGDKGAFLQTWMEDADGEDGHYYIYDVASIPEGYACREDWQGSYMIKTDDNCQYQICGESDECLTRSELMADGLSFNIESEDGCFGELEYVPFGKEACSADGSWDRDPYDCTDQYGGDKCLFCHGVANGKESFQCLDRNGGVCNTIFQSLPAKEFCNLEFECSASTLTFSVMIVFSLLVTLF